MFYITVGLDGLWCATAGTGRELHAIPRDMAFAAPELF